MKYAEPCCTEFCSCYLQQWDSIDLFSYRTLGHGQNGQLQDFSINRRTLKLAVSYKEIDEINWFLVCPNNFLRNGSLAFFDFGHNGR